MRRLTTRIPILLALGAQLTTVWLALAPGLVVCMEADGRVAVEATVGGGVCGDTAPSREHPTQSPVLMSSVASHCEGCQDVPLFLASDVAAGHQHAMAVTSIDAATLSTSALPSGLLTHRQHVITSARPIARIPSLRSTILRI